MNKYLKFEYWNECDLGNIYYQGGQHFIFYLDADVGEPLHEEVEEGQENGDGDFIPTYRRQIKRYRIRTGLIPDFLIDAMQRMKLHDNIELTFKTGEIEKIYNVDIEPEWQFEKYAWQGTVTMTFDMDESITVGACCDNLVVGTSEEEPEPIPDFYWIAENGSDLTGDGSYARPWATLAYACSQVTTPGDVIHVKAGSYSETAQCNLSAGVSITGAGRLLSIITASSSFTNFIYASSAAGTLGNQSISNITLDANLLVTYGVRIYGRSNFTVHDFGLRNTNDYGLTYADQSGRDEVTEPTTWATNNSIYNSYFINCGSDRWYADSYWAASAAIDISGQDGMLIYDNNIDNVTGGRYAYGIKGLTGGGYHKGVKIFNNIIRTNIRDNVGEQSFGFNIELWTGVGGVQIYGNDCNGAIDMGGRGWWDAYGYGFACIVDGNTVIQATRPTNQGEAGLILESGGSGGMYFTNNYVGNFSTGMTLGCHAASLVQGYDNVVVSYNVFFNIGYVSGGAGAGIYGTSSNTEVTINGLKILNNVIHKVNNTSGFGIKITYATANTWTNCQVRNNIIYNAYTPINIENQTINGMNVDNNIIYGHTNGTIPDYTNSTVSNQTFNNNQVGVDPLFVSATDFHLQTGSPCINAGVYVGLTTDHDGRPVANPPEIGAYEYEEEAVPSYFWVATDGDDSTGDGSYTTPWKTLAYACTQATAGDTIMVGEGTFTETAQIVKPLGVSIMGQGQGVTIINSTYNNASAVQAAMQCASTPGTTVDDNSTLSHFTFTGSNRTSQRGIYIGYRNNFIIHHVTLEDFNRSGIYFDASQTSYPDLYITGCKVYSCIINDCSLREGAGGTYPGSLRMRGTDGLEVYDCVFDNTGRPNGQNGNTISPWRNKRLDFHDNVLYRNDHETSEAGVEEWNFFWEEWNYHGDSRVYRNTFYGLAQFSLGGLDNAVDEDCTFGYLVEENNFLNAANGNRTVNGNTRTIFGICVEGHNHKKVTISRNLLERFGFGIELSHPSANATYDRNWHWEDIIVAYNVLTECGYEDFAYGSAMWITHEADPPEYTSTYSNIAFINNTITSKKGTYTGYCGFLFNMHGTVTGLAVKNNIVDGFANDAVQINGIDGNTLTIIGLDVIHNNFYDNGTDVVDIEDDPDVDVTDIDILTGNITSNPLFVSTSDFHLQSTSPCINAGIDVGLTTDYDGQAVSDPPEIGAYQYIP